MEHVPGLWGGVGLLLGALALVYAIKADWHLREIHEAVRRMLRGSSS